MKTLVGILILINLGIFAYFNQDLFLNAPTSTTQAEINPAQIRLLSQAEIDAIAKNTPEPPISDVTTNVTTDEVNNAPLTACYEWGIFSVSNIANAQTTASKLLLQATLREQTTKESKRYWVYLPKLQNTAAAEQKAAELKSIGVTDLFVVQDAKWKNAISFGIFEDEQLATNLLKDLKAKGINNAVKAQRNQGGGHYSLFLINMSETDLKHLKEVKPDFPETSVKTVSCS